MYKHSFALAEVLIALVVVGGAFSFLIPAIRGATYTYRTLQQEGTCHYLADEYFSRAIVDCLSKRPTSDLKSFSNEMQVTIDHSNYRVVTRLSADDKKKDDNGEKFLITLRVTARPTTLQGDNSEGIIRETKLCVNPQK